MKGREPVPPGVTAHRAGIVVAVLTLAVCAPAVPALMVAVMVNGWPTWWLIIAGVAAAWAGDAVWVLIPHAGARRDFRSGYRRAGQCGCDATVRASMDDQR